MNKSCFYNILILFKSSQAVYWLSIHFKIYVLKNLNDVQTKCLEKMYIFQKKTIFCCTFCFALKYISLRWIYISPVTLQLFTKDLFSAFYRLGHNINFTGWHNIIFTGWHNIIFTGWHNIVFTGWHNIVWLEILSVTAEAQLGQKQMRCQINLISMFFKPGKRRYLKITTTVSLTL